MLNPSIHWVRGGNLWKTHPNSEFRVFCLFFSETVHQLLDENQRYLSQLTSLLQDATQEMEHSVMVWDTEVRECVHACKQIPEASYF